MVAFGAATSAVSTSASFSVAKPTGTVDGDLLIAFSVNDSGGMGLTGGSTWSELTADATTTLPYRVALKIAGASEPTNYTATQGAGNDCHVSILCIPGGSLSVVWAVDDSVQDGTSISTPSITPAGSTDLLIRFAFGQSANIPGVDFTAPASHTERTDQQSRTWSAGATATRELASSAATGTAAFTTNLSLSSAGGITVGITSSSVPATIDATTVDATADIDTPTITTTHNETATPDVVTATAAISTPTVTASDSTITTAVVTATAAIDAPTVTAVRHDTVSPATVDAQSEISTPGLVVPVLPGQFITGNFQIEWASQLYGGYGNVYQVVTGSVEGWDDLPGLDSDSALRPSRHGAWPGRSLGQQREVSAIIAVNDPNTFIASMRALRRATSIAEDDAEYALVISTYGEALLAYGSISARSIPAEHYGQGWAQVSLRWICSDPRRFDLTQQSVVIAADGSQTLTNEGDTATSPRFRILGPAVDPVLINETSDRILGFDLTLTGGQLLEIDTQLGTVKIGDVSYMSTLSSESVPVEDFVLASGDNLVTFETSSGGTAGAETIWRSAFI